MAGNYPELIQPIVPDAQHNRAPDLLIEGFTRGMAAFAQFAQIRRQQESDLAHLALQERMANEQHALEQQKLSQAAELIPSQIEANQAHAEMMKAQGQAYLSGSRTAAQLKQAATEKKEALFNEVGKNVAELQLEDVDFQTKNPVKFGMNVQAFAKMYRFSPVPEIRSAIKQYQRVADEQKIVMKHAMVGEDGVITATGQGVHTPLWKVAMNASDPATSEQTMRDLEASGHMDIVEGIRNIHGNDVPTRSVKPNAKLQSAMNEAASLTSPVANTPVDYSTPVADRVRVKGPDGQVGTIPADQLQDALAKGYTQLQ